MADKIVLTDTSILIDYFRKKDKSKTKLIELLDRGYEFCICVVTEYEIYSGATIQQNEYWKDLLQRIIVLPFDQSAAQVAVTINNKLKLINKQIDTADLFIAAIAISNDLPFVTLNKKHFERIEDLELVE
ncbi:MAG: type II toxin-antitoxin system VapC family toxin [Mucilaginibacter sp.]|uniref:type II toxin-antitoxin system VapC family toxin n=1 Tax=Mucilaginibacter sp. TaxID=1882438 RepID=UPI003262D874